MMEDFALDQLTMLDTTYEENTLLDDLKDVIQQMLSTIQDEVKKVILAALLLVISAPTTPAYADVDTVMEYCITQESTYDTYMDRLERMRSLDDNWDGEGAMATSCVAIDNATALVNRLPFAVLEVGLKLYPTELGAVGFKLKTASGLVRGEVGIDNMSYFVRLGKTTTHHSFEQWNDDNISVLVSSLSNLV